MNERQALCLLDLIAEQVKNTDLETRQLGNNEFVVIVDKHWFCWSEDDWHDKVKPQLPAKKIASLVQT